MISYLFAHKAIFIELPFRVGDHAGFVRVPRLAILSSKGLYANALGVI